MPDISKITLPSGNTYEIKDRIAREMISGGVSFNIVWSSTDYASSTEPTAEKLSGIPKDVVVYYNNGASSATGSLVASSDTKGKFYLIYSKTQTSDIDAFDEYVTVGPDSALTWEKIGDTQIDLSNVVTDVSLSKQTATVLTSGSSLNTAPSAVSFSGGSNDEVLGSGTTFTNSTSSVSFGALTGHTDTVLGTGTTFTVTDPTITVTPSQTYLGATASGTAVGANGTANAVTGYPDLTTDTFVKSVTAETGKNLVTTSIVPTNGTESVSKVTRTASKLVTTTVPNVTGNTQVSIPNVTGNTNVSIPNVTSNIDRDLSFEMGTGADSETLIISIFTNDVKDTSSNRYNGSDTTLGTALSASKVTLGTNLTATNTTLGTAKTVATGAVASNGTGSDIVTGVTITDKDVAKVGTAVTVATGATATTGTGDAVVTGVTVGSSASAITGLGTPSTAAALTGVKVTAQPTITLAANTATATGRVQVATGISSASASGGAVSASGDNVTAVVSMPTATAAAQTITVGTNDKVTAITNIGTGTVTPDVELVPSTATVLTNSTDITVTKGR